MILVVDDEHDVVRLMSTLLKHMGYQTQAAYSGEEALKVSAETPPDLVILDVMMPGIDGLEVLRQLKSHDRTAKIPVVMYSAASGDDYQFRAKASGAVDYWVKASTDFDHIRARLGELVPTH
jgi:CheY-like chemotaxis protein